VFVRGDCGELEIGLLEAMSVGYLEGKEEDRGVLEMLKERAVLVCVADLMG